jgi:hypothetical protein
MLVSSFCRPGPLLGLSYHSCPRSHQFTASASVSVSTILRLLPLFACSISNLSNVPTNLLDATPQPIQYLKKKRKEKKKKADGTCHRAGCLSSFHLGTVMLFFLFRMALLLLPLLQTYLPIYLPYLTLPTQLRPSHLGHPCA